MKFIYLFCIILFPFVGQAQNTMLNLASDVWPPFTNVVGEKAFAKELVEEALNRAEYHVKTTITDFTDVLSGLQSEEFDGSAALWKDYDRVRYMNFSNPYLQNRLILVGRKDSDVSSTDLSDLDGKRVAIVQDYAYGATLLDNPAVTFVKGRNDQENLDRLMSGEVDYMLVDDLLIHYLLTYQADEVDAYLKIGRNIIVEQSLYFAVRKNLPNSLDIIDAFNREIMAMLKDGTYNRILELNWIKSDVDNDGHQELILAGNDAGSIPPSSGYSVMVNDKNVPSKNHPDDERYFIDGVIYDNWESVPGTYKLGQDGKDTAGMSLLKFNF